VARLHWTSGRTRLASALGFRQPEALEARSVALRSQRAGLATPAPLAEGEASTPSPNRPRRGCEWQPCRIERLRTFPLVIGLGRSPRRCPSDVVGTPETRVAFNPGPLLLAPLYMDDRYRFVGHAVVAVGWVQASPPRPARWSWGPRPARQPDASLSDMAATGFPPWTIWWWSGDEQRSRELRKRATVRVGVTPCWYPVSGCSIVSTQAPDQEPRCRRRAERTASAPWQTRRFRSSSASTTTTTPP